MRILMAISALLIGVSGPALGLEVQVDGEMIDLPVCGGLAGILCDDDEWCDYPASAPCGEVDQFGVCRPRPEVCIELYQPVCGCDGQDYGNGCMAAAEGTDVAYPGVCRGSS